MIGVLDSGRGGLVAYKELRRLMPRVDITYLADRKNAPYGNKNPSEILRLTECGIRRLCDVGCEMVLIACCTASSLHEMLPEELRNISIPISTICTFTRRIAVTVTRAETFWYTSRCCIERGRDLCGRQVSPSRAMPR